jgi:hypothetical protein
MWIRSTLIVATAIATLGLGSPAFAGGVILRQERVALWTPARGREPHWLHLGSRLQGHKMTGSGADHVTNNAGNGNRAQCQRH